MARKQNPIESVPIKLSTTQAVAEDLDRLVETGYFGKTRAEAAEQLLRIELSRRIESNSFGNFVDHRKRSRKRG